MTRMTPRQRGIALFIFLVLGMIATPIVSIYVSAKAAAFVFIFSWMIFIYVPIHRKGD